ncbi:MAG: hypothetical protein ACRC3H_21370 [Lachnospiraceae bacterium]
MKSKGYVAGLLIGIILVIAAALSGRWDWADGIKIALSVCGAIIISICYVRLTYNKIIRDKNMKRKVFDERNVMILEKTSHVTNSITCLLLGIAAVIFIVLEYTIPAVIIGVIIIVQPIIMIVVSERIEKQF